MSTEPRPRPEHSRAPSGPLDRRGRGRRRASSATLAAAAILTMVAPLGLPATMQAQDRLGGEYGLWVRYAEPPATGARAAHGPADTNAPRLIVGWLTEEARGGLLEVVTDGELILRRETEEGQGHEVAFPVPETEELLLRYGAAPSRESASATPDGASRTSPSASRLEAGAASGLHETRIRLRAGSDRPSGILTGVDSLFVVGDVHGEYDSLFRVLQGAGLVDSRGRWSGGSRHVVFLGDVFDRGPDVTKTLWFLYRLEHEAAAAGGGAHVVLGNHEVMIFTHDLRYVSPKERLIARLHGAPYYDLYDVRTSVLGRWLARRPAAMKVDDVLLAHGGITPRFMGFEVDELNDSIAGFLEEDLFYGWSDTTVVVVSDSAIVEQAEEVYRKVVVMDSAGVALRNQVFFGDQGPLWFRGYVLRDDLEEELQRVLDAHDARIHVVGHTALRTIESRYDGRLLAVDLQDPATEGLLLVRDPRTREYRGWRYGAEGRISDLEVPGPP